MSSTVADTEQAAIIEALRADISAIAADRQDISNRYENLLQEQVVHDREVYAAARANAQRDRGGWEATVRRAFHRQYLEPLNVLAYQASILPERPKKADLDPLRNAAPECLRMLREPPQDADTRLATQMNAEIQRLRGLVVAAGRQLHSAAGLGEVMSCRCAGCELIRDMDDVRDGGAK